MISDHDARQLFGDYDRDRNTRQPEGRRLANESAPCGWQRLCTHWQYFNMARTALALLSYALFAPVVFIERLVDFPFTCVVILVKMT